MHGLDDLVFTGTVKAPAQLRDGPQDAGVRVALDGVVDAHVGKLGLPAVVQLPHTGRVDHEVQMLFRASLYELPRLQQLAVPSGLFVLVVRVRVLVLVAFANTAGIIAVDASADLYGRLCQVSHKGCPWRSSPLGKLCKTQHALLNR